MIMVMMRRRAGGVDSRPSLPLLLMGVFSRSNKHVVVSGLSEKEIRGSGAAFGCLLSASTTTTRRWDPVVTNVKAR
jgi:hypothetical protein